MARAEQITDRCSYHGEGPFWDERRSRLRFVDMLAGDVLTLLPNGQVTRRHIDDIAAVIRAREEGGYAVAIEQGFALFDEDWIREGTIRAFDAPAIRMNEGGCDPQGRLYCGSMAYDASPNAGTIFRLDTDHTVRPILTDVSIPNGLQWSADGDRAFHTDTTTGTISVYDFDATEGLLLNPRPFITVDPANGAPDGCAMDDEGGLWVALWGGAGVRRYDRDGTLTELIELPTTNVTACTFAGPGSSELFITTSRENVDPDGEPAAGALFRATVGTRGVSQHRYAA